jgi:hypothetical protein
MRAAIILLVACGAPPIPKPPPPPGDDAVERPAIKLVPMVADAPTYEALCTSELEAQAMPDARCEPPAASSGPIGPFQDVRVFAIVQSATVPNNSCYLAVRTSAGWAMRILYGDCFGTGKYARQLHDVKVGITPARDVVVRFALQSTDPIDDGDVHTREYAEETFLALCGVSQAGALGCSDTLQLSFTATRDDGTHHAWALESSFLPDGRLRIRAASGAADMPTDARQLVGTHALAHD